MQYRLLFASQAIAALRKNGDPQDHLGRIDGSSFYLKSTREEAAEAKALYGAMSLLKDAMHSRSPDMVLAAVELSKNIFHADQRVFLPLLHSISTDSFSDEARIAVGTRALQIFRISRLFRH